MCNICCYILTGVLEGNLHIYDTKYIRNIDVPIRAYCTLLGCMILPKYIANIYLAIKTTRKVQYNFFLYFYNQMNKCNSFLYGSKTKL